MLYLLLRSSLIVLLLMAGGCKTTPTVKADDASSARAIVVADQHHAVSRDVSRVAQEAGDSRDDLLQHHLQYIAARPGPALSDNNDVRLLIDGPKTYDAMFGAIALARDHINLEVYIFQDDEIGRSLIDLLKRKQAQGVQVNLIYDSVGSIDTPKSVFDDLRGAGIKVFEFNPINPAEGAVLDLNNRDHRKLLVVDGRVAFTGGINISSVYASGSGGNLKIHSKSTKPPTERGWRDTQIEVRGPAVAAMQKIFFDTWNLQDEAARQPQPGLSPHYYPPPHGAGDRLLRVIASTPNDSDNLIYVDLLSAIQQSRHSVHLTMAYFSPDAQTIDALQAAAARGVDVELVLPGFSDIELIFEAGRSHYTKLLKSGVKIYERHDALVHAKTAVIDGVWSTVGSMNMDIRSFLHNNEINVVVLGKGFGGDMEAMFQQDVAKAEPIPLEKWCDRPFSQRMKQWFARVWAYWL
jgi:cardiolipin synthase